MLTNIDQGDLRGHGRRKDFSRRGALEDFSKIFLGEVKSDKICFFHSKLRKQHFLLRFSKSRGSKALPAPLRRHQRGCNTVNIHNPLTALLGWDKLSSDC